MTVVDFAFDSDSGSFLYDSDADSFKRGCNCCAPGCECVAASPLPSFSDCTPCSLRLTFDGYGGDSCAAVGTAGVFWVTLDAPDAGGYCLDVIAGTSDDAIYQPSAATGKFQYGYTDAGCTTPASPPSGEITPHVDIVYFAPDFPAHPLGQTFVNVSWDGDFGGNYGFLGQVSFDRPLTSADFPLAITNDNPGGGTATVSIECCGNCSSCPDERTLGSCCYHYLAEIQDLACFPRAWDLYTGAVSTDGWKSAGGEAKLYCDTGQWKFRVTDICNVCGFGSTSYIEWTAGITTCPPSLASHYTLTHNDFGGTPVLHDFTVSPGCALGASNCDECCATYVITFADTGCAALDGAHTFTRIDDHNCQWNETDPSNNPANRIFCDSANNQWIVQLTGAAADCGVDGVIQFAVPMRKIDSRQIYACPLTSPVDGSDQWSCIRNDFGNLITPSISSITTSDCGCVTPICPTDCSACVSCFILVVSSDSDPYGINGTYTFTIEVDSCNWTDGTNDLTCNEGVWSMTFRPSVPASLVIVFTAAVDDSGCPPVNNDTTWAFASCTPGEGATCPDPDPTYALGFESCP